MKTITLKEVLEITRQPYYEEDELKWALEEHAVSVLPEVVEALSKLANIVNDEYPSGDERYTEAQKAFDVIARASQVTIP